MRGDTLLSPGPHPVKGGILYSIEDVFTTDSIKLIVEFDVWRYYNVVHTR